MGWHTLIIPALETRGQESQFMFILSYIVSSRHCLKKPKVLFTSLTLCSLRTGPCMKFCPLLQSSLSKGKMVVYLGEEDRSEKEPDMAVSSRAGREHTKPSQATDTSCAFWLMVAAGRKRTASRTQSGWESCGKGAWLETLFFWEACGPPQPI